MSRLPLALIVMLICSVALAACLPIMAPNRLVGSGRPATRDYPVAGFTAVSADSAFQVKLTSGDDFKVSVTVDDNLQDYVVVKQAGDMLYIGFDAGRRAVSSVRRAQANVTLPKLTRVQLNGASRADMSGFGHVPTFQAGLDGASQLNGDMQADTVQVQLNGASRLNGRAQAGSVQVQLNGASTAALGGSGQTLSLVADGASRGELGAMPVSEANVKLNGASQATVRADATLNYNVDGGSALRYIGSPGIGEASSNGGSRVTHG